jgi:hypothetical protein
MKVSGEWGFLMDRERRIFLMVAIIKGIFYKDILKEMMVF